MKKVWEDKEELLEALKNYGILAFSNASEELRRDKEVVIKVFENGADFGELYDETIIDEDIAEAIFASNGPKETFETAADAYEKLVELVKIVRIFNEEVRYEENYAEDLDADTQMLDSDFKMLDLMSFFVGNIHILMEDADALIAAMTEVSAAMKFEESSYKFVQHWDDWKNIFDTIKSYISENGICEASYNYYRDAEKLKEKAIEWSKEMAMYRYSHCGTKIGGVSNLIYHASKEVAVPVLLSECWK